jgi:hypothetical protein
VLCRKALDCLTDFTEAAHSRRIPHFARAHAGLDQSANRCGNRALPGALDLFAGIAFAKSEAVTDRTRVTLCFRSDKFAHIIDSQACSFVSVIDDPATRIGAKAIRLAIHAIKLFMLDVMKNRFPLDWTAFGPCGAARIQIWISSINHNARGFC